MQMLVSEGNDEIETVENLIFGKTLEMLQKYEDTLDQIGLHVLISMEGWCQKQRRIIKVGQTSILSGDKYEGVIALYPIKDALVLRNEQTREVPCAAVICCRKEREGDAWKISEDGDSVRKLQGQLEELIEEFEYSGYVQDENETAKIRQEAKKIQIY